MPNYKESGVDFDLIGKFRSNLISELKYKGDRFTLATDIGHYAGLVKFGDGYLAMHTDGVGSKTILAEKYDYFDEIGYDLVGMNVNDLVSMGAEPIAMVDYIASSIFSPDIGSKIGKSINEACIIAGIPVVGGETASLPDIINGIDISGTVVGYLDNNNIIDGSRIQERDVIIGLRSSGVHSNGFSLIRRIYQNKENKLNENFNGKPFWRSLMKGTNIYSKAVLNLIDKYEIHGLAHITGGGFRNLVRLSHKKFLIDNFEISPIFLKIKEDGNLLLSDMFETFNMGFGYIIVSPKSLAEDIIQEMRQFNPDILGRIEGGEGVVLKQYNISFKSYY